MLGVLPDKWVKGVRSVEDDIGMFSDPEFIQLPVTLEEMLTTEWSTDAHFTCYFVEGLDAWPRINKTALPGLQAGGDSVLTEHFVFDYDLPGHAEWSSEAATAFGQIVDALPAPFSLYSALYTTLHGARLIYTLSSPVPVDKAEQHLTWMIHSLREAGLEVDTSCRDWTRLFRCPRVLRDGLRTENAPHFFCETYYRILPIDALHTLPTNTIAKKRTPTKRSKQPYPPQTELEALLQGPDKKPTQLYDRAKEILKKNTYYKVCFGLSVSGWEPGEYNDRIAEYLGSVLPPLVREGLSPKECMAIVFPPLYCIPETDRDYKSHSWNLLQDIHERETVKWNDILEARAQQALEQAHVLDRMTAGVRTWYPLPEDEEDAREFVRRHTLLSHGKTFYHLNEDGFVRNFSISKDQLIPRIRTTFLDDVIPTERVGQNDQLIDVSPNVIQNRYSTIIQTVEMEYLGDRDGFVIDMDGMNPKLVLPMYRRNRSLEPKHHPLVDEWLQHLGGDCYPNLVEWISNALDFEGGPICALSIKGHKGTGKLLLATGLAECLEEPAVASVNDLTVQSSTLTRTPFLVVNEGMPKSSRYGTTIADQFKGLVSGDPICINEKHKPIIYIHNPVRILFTANDKELMRGLVKGNGMSFDTRKAIGDRVLHIDADDSAHEFFTRIGNLKTTAKKGATWIAGYNPSDYVVARHFLWLYENRQAKERSDRFLVMGNSTPAKSDLFSDILTTKDVASVVCFSLLRMIKNDKVIYHDGGVYVTHKAVYDSVTAEDKVSFQDVITALQTVMKSEQRVVIDGKECGEVDLDLLHRFAVRHGV